jgi:hypothetical protein
LLPIKAKNLLNRSVLIDISRKTSHHGVRLPALARHNIRMRGERKMTASGSLAVFVIPQIDVFQTKNVLPTAGFI